MLEMFEKNHWFISYNLQQHKQRCPTVHQSTIETDNKKRPGIMKRNSIKYQPLPPELPDPNSGTCQF